MTEENKFPDPQQRGQAQEAALLRLWDWWSPGIDHGPLFQCWLILTKVLIYLEDHHFYDHHAVHDQEQRGASQWGKGTRINFGDAVEALHLFSNPDHNVYRPDSIWIDKSDL